jgi:hypothetical protein
MLQFPDTLRYDLLCAMGEFVGTFMFLFFSFAGAQLFRDLTDSQRLGLLPRDRRAVQSRGTNQKLQSP